MDSEAIIKQLKSLKIKAKAAKKEGKKALSVSFRRGAERIHRKLKAAKSKIKQVAAKA